jgi:hypothetical protein
MESFQYNKKQEFYQQNHMHFTGPYTIYLVYASSYFLLFLLGGNF